MKVIVLLNNIDQPQHKKPVLQSFDDAKKSTVIYEHEEIMRIKENNYQEGYSIGYQEGYDAAAFKMKSENDIAEHNILDGIRDHLEKLKTEQETYNARITDHLLTFFKTVSLKLFPFCIEKYGIEEIESIAQKINNILLHKEKPTMYISVTLLDKLKEKSSEVLDLFNIQEKNNFAPYEFNVCWENGGAHINLDELHQKIHQLIEDHIKTSI